MVEEKILKDLGLTEIEAKIYLACLELGTDSVLHIAKKAEIKRPTCYLSLDNLFEKGLVSKIEKKNTTLYSAEDPHIILNKYKEKVANFQDLLPFFHAKFNKGPKPKIRYYEGKEALWEIYTKVIFPEEKIYFFGTDTKKLIDNFPTLVNYWLKNHSSKCKEFLELVSYNKEGLEYMETSGKNREIRIMPKNLPVFADIGIVKNKLFIVSLDNLFGVLIESEDIAKTFKSFFDLAWMAAKTKIPKSKNNKIPKSKNKKS
jgi:HTH-type transcriptional regulator, sugar sensing transcriptional regulator